MQRSSSSNSGGCYLDASGTSVLNQRLTAASTLRTRATPTSRAALLTRKPDASNINLRERREEEDHGEKSSSVTSLLIIYLFMYLLLYYYMYVMYLPIFLFASFSINLYLFEALLESGCPVPFFNTSAGKSTDQSETHLGAKTFHTMRCLLRIAAAHTEAKTCE